MARIQLTFATELAVLVECTCLSCVYWAFHMRSYCIQDAGICVPGAWQEYELHSRNEARVFSRAHSGLTYSCPVLPSNKAPRLDCGALFWKSLFGSRICDIVCKLFKHLMSFYFSFFNKTKKRKGH